MGDVLPGAGGADAGCDVTGAGKAEGGWRAGVRGSAEEDLLQELLHEDASEERPLQCMSFDLLKIFFWVF